jgi:hypothetical protein
MRFLLVPLLLGITFPVSLASNPSEIKATEPEVCSVRAWVRAEDLLPDHISRGTSHAVSADYLTNIMKASSESRLLA